VPVALPQILCGTFVACDMSRQPLMRFVKLFAEWKNISRKIKYG
jgi:hypothetical protein